MQPRLPAIDNILVATDFSETASAATGWATMLARQHRARLHFVHAVDVASSADLSGGTRQTVNDDAVEKLETLERSTADAGIAASSEWGTGKAWKVIVDAQRRCGADLVVVGARGGTVYARLLLGSTADRVIRTCPVPVLTVHGEDAGREGDCGTVLVATDFSEESSRATAAAVRLLQIPDRGGQLVLLHVCHLPVIFETEAVAAAVASQVAEDESLALQQLESLAASLRTDALQVDVLVRQGYPAGVIAEEARSLGACVIAIGTHGHSGLKHFFLGSVAERVVHHAPCPVITTRCEEA